MSSSYFKTISYRPASTTPAREAEKPATQVIYQSPSLLEKKPAYTPSNFQILQPNPYRGISAARPGGGSPYGPGTPAFGISPPSATYPAPSLGSLPGSVPSKGAPDFSISPPPGTFPAPSLPPTSGKIGIGPSPGKGNVSLDVPFYSQFQAGNGFTPGNTACFSAAVAMAKAAGATVLGSDQRIQVGLSEDSKGCLSVDPKAAAEGRGYIDSELAAGRPVVVGVSHKDDSFNVDGLTDHFVTITGTGVDANGKTYYTFNDPGTSHTDLGDGALNPNNRFYVDEKSGNLYRPGTAAEGYTVDRRFEVAMVRKNAESA